jgi:putative flippase GtrA
MVIDTMRGEHDVVTFLSTYAKAGRVFQFSGSVSNSLSQQLYRYAFVGGIAFCFDFGTLFVLSRFLGVHYMISAVIAFIIGLAVNYALSTTFVFAKRSVGNEGIAFLIFALIGVAGLGLNELFIWLFTEIAGFHYLWSKVVSTAFVYLWNFFARKYSLFR